ncbi:NAD(P)/FAD-dependent oxidoreductase [Ketogulonicigenium vulgare]|uniref:D-amino acid dehydrogenase small subunit n=2 Tax=Ketogulonicigenium vulgare TaxID=92945 RepID=F9Y7N3_KETVW|nr:FAD-dependent oxidoreductase [Ketogulonicigenium vulgare]AEM42329.1 D-amino acid dehydrogenase small subunit [Ketogulonicigenium vulgare WSH-001]ALJ79953.1 oxidoreductase [Ketogulonicigenium vulgare]ANW32846.1 oxidoreductase [Ketogulonicigenium vulgare]AOZ53409.1 D-amino acid dehydrogenase small subunit [Ketogulonicigenium vulgare]
MRAIVIGAGMFGASTALQLARRGVQVKIFDFAHNGKATMAGAGIVCPWATQIEEPAWYEMYAAGARFYDTLIADLNGAGETDLGYRKVGALVTSQNADDFKAAGARIARRAATAPEAGDVRLLSPKDAQALFPVLKDGLEAWFIPGGARVDARLLSAAMVRQAIALGAEFSNDYVTLVQGPEGTAVRDGSGTLHTADEVIVAGGAWASQILAPLGVDHPVKPQKGQIVHLRLAGVQTAQWPVLLPMTSHYMLAFDDSRIVVGATREVDSGFDYRVTATGQASVLEAGMAIAPGLAHAEIIETRIGFRPAGPTIKPIFGRVPGAPGLSLANGLGAGGISIGPFAGKLLADVLTGKQTEVPVAPYAPQN